MSRKLKENRRPTASPSDDGDDFQPMKRKKLSRNRFASPLSEEVMSNVSMGPTVANTKKSTDWAVRVFIEWRKQRNESQSDKCPLDLLESPSAGQLNCWLSRFATEARRADGDRYPSSTLYQLLAGLLRYARSHSKDCPNFLDRQDPRFAELRGTCESVSRELRQSGVGAQVKHAPTISSEEEDKLWNSGAIGIYSPRALVRCVFYYVGKAFCLRGGQEQRNLKPSQFERGYEPDRYTYTENGSKNHQGRFGTRKESNKVVTIYANFDNAPKCLVYLLDFYFSKFPKPPTSMETFYLKPLAKVPAKFDDPWFECTPIGKNVLAKFVQVMCEDTGIREKKTNHSLRATGVTSLFTAEVPEKLIKGISGHKSSQALQIYERPTVSQKQAVSRVLTTQPSGSNRDSYLQELQKLPASASVQPTPSSQSSTMMSHVQSQRRVMQLDSSSFISSMFNGVSNCTINISPQQLNVHLQPQGRIPQGPIPNHPVDEFDALVNALPGDF